MSLMDLELGKYQNSKDHILHGFTGEDVVVLYPRTTGGKSLSEMTE
jgi:hypothetical protein